MAIRIDQSLRRIYYLCSSSLKHRSERRSRRRNPRPSFPLRIQDQKSPDHLTRSQKLTNLHRIASSDPFHYHNNCIMRSQILRSLATAAASPSRSIHIQSSSLRPSRPTCSVRSSLSLPCHPVSNNLPLAEPEASVTTSSIPTILPHHPRLILPIPPLLETHHRHPPPNPPRTTPRRRTSPLLQPLQTQAPMAPGYVQALPETPVPARAQVPTARDAQVRAAEVG
jgi:hypothetical protein